MSYEQVRGFFELGSHDYKSAAPPLPTKVEKSSNERRRFCRLICSQERLCRGELALRKAVLLKPSQIPLKKIPEKFLSPRCVTTSARSDLRAETSRQHCRERYGSTGQLKIKGIGLLTWPSIRIGFSAQMLSTWPKEPC